ncbi:hypothetical protein RFI02_14410 [Acinetobacter sichuanensis]|uniref:hypothetical protein n=1 Tax=Acinetobacter sichuanensis TaxID=2136183 RepID=UPI0028107E6C|nr:hypothetical protein [Acinetobacter sichuanensis]MDQ9022297.1 hypothetical protein [Acinetobacter sichuanensis]
MSHSRVADSTIKGFIYQFNKTILEILDSPAATIHVEGIVEDVDVYEADNSITAIQCKYHESAKSFTLSLIYKPIILMIKTFIGRPNDELSFVLFIHIPSEEQRDRGLSIEEVDQILCTQTEKLKKIIDELDLDNFDKQKFVDHLIIRFGKSIEDLEEEIKTKIEGLDRFKAFDVDGLIYPNLLSEIQRISTVKDHTARMVTKQEIFSFLDKQSKSVINKWTLMTKSRKALLKQLRNDFRTQMNPNSLSRCFIFQGFNSDEIGRVIHFINSYVGKYLKKPSHKPASFIFDIDEEKFKELVSLLYDQEIEVNDGMVGGIWKDNKFYKDCKIRRKPRNEITADFHVRAQTTKQKGFEIRNNFFDQKKIFGFVEAEMKFSPDTIVINNFDEVEYLFNFRTEI